MCMIKLLQVELDVLTPKKFHKNKEEKMNTLGWLEEWYYSNCNDDWEHCYGIKIGNIDNPGWTVEIDLVNTCLEDKTFETVQVQRTDTDWVYCCVKGEVFNGTGGAKNLEDILIIFKQWAEDSNDI